MNEQLVRWLFETNAVRVCPSLSPFWYTSGKIGPYYVNTHFLYGNEDKATKLLAVIEKAKEYRSECSKLIETVVMVNYVEDKIFRGTIDAMLGYLKANIPLEEVAYISGGERRDWFFSLAIANKLALPHLTIFKDMNVVLYENGETTTIKNLNGAKVLHIADLITTASSYARAWVPAIEAINGQILWSLVAVDRLQGGGQVLKNLGVDSHALTSINIETFEQAASIGYVDQDQLAMVKAYMEDPDGAMMAFLKKHPSFFKDAQKSGKKDAERARLCVEQNFYGVKDWLV